MAFDPNEFDFLDLPQGGVDLDSEPATESATATAVETALNPADFLCTESSGSSDRKYTPCGKPAVHFIKTRDPKAYPMCEACSHHNTKNRAAKIIAPRSRDEIADISEVQASFVSYESDSAKAEQEPEEDPMIMNPLTGALVNTNDIDSLILAAVDTKKQISDLQAFEDTIRRRIGEFTTGTAKTRRVRGKTLLAKVEMPDETWDQTMLKEAWNSYPLLRDELLRLGSVNVKMTEFKKLANTATDNPAFGQFAQMIKGAQRPATGAPRITLEKTE